MQSHHYTGANFMLINLTSGFLIMALCLLLQSILIGAAMRYYAGHHQEVNSPSLVEGLKVVNIVMLLLVIGNLGQIAVWALAYQVLGEFATFSEAFYHSAVNFSTLGYGDIVMSDEHKLLGPLESINGILMIGVSTAALMSAYQDVVRRTMRAQQAGNTENAGPR